MYDRFHIILTISFRSTSYLIFTRLYMGVSTLGIHCCFTSTHIRLLAEAILTG